MEKIGEVKVENRKYPRINFKLAVHYAPVEKGAIPKPVKSNAEDMGAGGMAMQSREFIEPGNYVTLNLYLPSFENLQFLDKFSDFPVNDCIAITILSKIVWCRKMKAEGYLVGIQFCDIDPQKKKLLKHFLVEYEMDEPLE
ncbi:PilZ domain-containing protein [bacterium]|nr:PilZ domain-containing protein [bacterium]